MREFKGDERINFVDNSDVYVGYDFTGSCCEYFGYIYARSIPEDKVTDVDMLPKINAPADLESFNFDPTFFKQVNLYDHPSGGDGAIAFFKLINGDATIYLGLFNQHNGYYSHGFDIKVGGKVIKSGNI